jgi:hypothetical protein
MEKRIDNKNSVEMKSFYSNIRPIALFCKLLGTFTLSNALTSDGKLLKYKLFSIHFLWPVFLQFTATWLLWKYEAFPWWILSGPFETYRSLAVIILCVYDKYLLDLIHHIEEFDKVYLIKCGRSPTKTYFGNGKVWVLISSIFFVICMLLILMISRSYPEKSLIRAILDTAFIVLPWIAHQSFLIQYVLFCINISSRFIDISSQFKILITISRIERVRAWSTMKQNGDLEFEESFANIGKLYWHLLETVMKLNKSFGIKLANHLVICFVQMLLDVYQFSYNYGMNAISATVFLSYQTFSILIVGVVTEYLTSSVST